MESKSVSYNDLEVKSESNQDEDKEEDQEEDDQPLDEQESSRSALNSILSITMSLIQNCTLLGFVYYMGVKNYSIMWLIPPVLVKIILGNLPTTSTPYSRKAHIASLSALLGEKKVITSLLHDLPSWVFFPDYERAEWVNKILLQLWPSANKFVRTLLKERIGPTIADSLKGFRFEYVSLGRIPPRIGGIKVYEVAFVRDQIVMDIDFIYASDCDINFSLGGLKGGIKNLNVIGPLRVVLKPLIKEIPLIGAVQIFFLNNPHLNYNLDGVADLLNTPGLQKMLKTNLLSAIADLMVLPNKFVVTLSDNVKAEEIKKPEPAGLIRIHVLEAKNLINTDKIGKSDPYVNITLGAQKFQSQVIQNNLNPVWDYWCEAVGEVSQKLQIAVYDQDDTRNDESLGRVLINVQHVIDHGVIDDWFNLEETSSGSIHIRLFWYSLSTEIADLDAMLEENKRFGVSNLSVALLVVFVDSARDLPMRTKDLPNPIAFISVGNNTHSTPVDHKKINPVWEKGFCVPIGNPNFDQLFVKVCDTKEKYEIGNLTFPLSLLLKKSNMSARLQPFQLANSGSESKIVMSLKLHILKTSVQISEVRSTMDLRRRKTAGGKSNNLLERTDSATSVISRQSNISNPSSSGYINPRYDPEINSASESMIGAQDRDMANSSEALVSKKSADKLLLSQPSRASSTSSGEYGRGRIHLTLRYNMERQKLYVTIHRIVNIPMTDPSNIPDPYVKLYMLPGRSKDSKRRTNVVKDSCNPIYENTFEYVLCESDLYISELEVKVCSQKGFLSGGSPVIGKVTISLQSPDIQSIDGLSTWFDLESDN